MDKQTYHLAIRFAENRLQRGDVVEIHNSIVTNVGYVWFGKMGLPIAETKINQLKQQIAENRPTFVYLVKTSGKKSSFYIANILDISRDLPASEIGRFPSYYEQYGLITYIKTWIKLSKIAPLNSEHLDNMKVVGSVLTLRETLSRSASGHFWVQKVRNES